MFSLYTQEWQCHPLHCWLVAVKSNTLSAINKYASMLTYILLLLFIWWCTGCWASPFLSLIVSRSFIRQSFPFVHFFLFLILSVGNSFCYSITFYQVTNMCKTELWSWIWFHIYFIFFLLMLITVLLRVLKQWCTLT